MSYYVYILGCSDGTYYTGVTSNLEKRLQEHQSGRYPNSHTHSRRPVQLKWYASFQRVEQAIEKEKQLKKWSRAKKKSLIEDDWDRVSKLSRKTFD